MPDQWPASLRLLRWTQRGSRHGEPCKPISNESIFCQLVLVFGKWVFVFQKNRAFCKPVLVIVEPDLWGFLQNAASGTGTAANVPASVATSGFADAAGFPNNPQGFPRALLHMRDKDG